LRRHIDRLEEWRTGYCGFSDVDRIERSTTMSTQGPRTLRPSEVGIECQVQLSSFYGIFILSSLMFDGRPADAILDLAAEAVPSLGTCRTEAVYRVVDGSLLDIRNPSGALDSGLDAEVAANVSIDREIVLSDSVWRYAITLRTMTAVTGVLVVRAPSAASCHELFLLKLLAQQAAAAMASAELVEQERRQRVALEALAGDQAKTINRLSRNVSELERREHIHKALTAVSMSGSGEAGMAQALYELTSLAVSVEDRFGNLRAWSPGPRPSAYRPLGGINRGELIRHAATNGQHSRHRDNVFGLIRPKTDLLGLVVLHDPDCRADDLDVFALEHATAVLGMELSHQRLLAETELRLRGELVDDLLAGTDNASAYSRADALGYNLRMPHRVTVMQWKAEVDSDQVVRSASRWATTAGLHPLCARRPPMTVLLTEDVPDPASLHRAISAAIGTSAGWIGIGSPAASPSELPRSFSEAQRALRIQQASVGQHGVRRFDDLGVCRILDPTHSGPEVRGFLTEWLGPLVAYDRDRNTDLVSTLARYLDSGGNYDQTACALNIHRSTLRYRLGRIRDISGHDLQDVDTRLNLHLATRVLGMIETTEVIQVC
jgi:sugar diacid utilization regulator